MSVGLLDFFILEASDYVERLDALLADAAPEGPDANECAKLARGLRGSATMAKVSGIAELAAAVERVSRDVHAQRMAWSPMLAAVLVGSVDDLKVLLHGVRAWGAPESTRVQARLDTIVALVPAARELAPTPSFASGGRGFVAERATEIAAAIDALLGAPGDRQLAIELLRQVRALRGVAALKDVPPVAEVTEAVERSAQPLELGTGTVRAEHRELFEAAATLLRQAAAGGAAASDTERFARAVSSLDAEAPADSQRVVPVAELAPEGEEHVVTRSPTPPTTPARRFGLEVVSQAEHLRRLRADAGAIADPIGRDRVALELRRALRTLQDSAASFGERDVARVAGELGAVITSLAPDVLDRVDRLAALLASPTDSPADRARHVSALLPVEGAARPALTPPSTAAAPEPSIASPAPSRPAPPMPEAGAGAAPPRNVSQTPTGRELHELLEDGIAGISQLDRQPLATRTAGAGEDVVPIGTLLYSGRAALHRAQEIRDQLRAASGAALPPPLVELFELLDLAAAD